MTGQAKAISQKSRAAIMAKLTAPLNGVESLQLPKESSYDYPTLTHQQRIDQFIKHLEYNQACVIKTSGHELANAITEQLTQRGINRLLYGENSPYSYAVESINAEIELCRYHFTIDDHKSTLFNDYPAGITSAKAAIAATGSIVVWPTANEPRTLSLVPPVHIVVVDANTLFADFASLIAAEQWQNKMPTNALLISGPSKTADIQQTLAYGAHGPKELIVMLLNSECNNDVC